MLAAIDVGSNTTRMLVGEVTRNQVSPHRYERRITRLKGGQTADGLAPESMERTLAALRQFKDIVAGYSLENICVVGTAAFRTATNSIEFTNRLFQQTGLDLEIINGHDEAQLSSGGVLSALDPQPETALIVDIGGGSTELAIVHQKNIIFKHSCPLGVVPLAEMSSLQQQNDFIDNQIAVVSELLSVKNIQDVATAPETKFIGTAGTLTTLAALDLRMAIYDWTRVNNYRMTAGRISSLAASLRALSIPERESLPGMESGRGDLILPGIHILQKLMGSVNKLELTVSDSGLLEGLLLKMAADAASH